jgi:hypothetical protein
MAIFRLLLRYKDHFVYLFAHHQEALYIQRLVYLCVLCWLAASRVGVELVSVRVEVGILIFTVAVRLSYVSIQNK